MVRILLVDDHPITRRGIRDILARVCAEVSFGEAADGQEALELMAVQSWDLILLDLCMPRLGGLEVLKKMRQRKLKIPVLILSIFPESDLRRVALKERAAGYVSKQASPKGLIAAVRQALSVGEVVRPRH